jgi:beta-galactosidase
VLGSETASTVSSRGVYKFPVVPAKSKAYDDGQCSGYDVEACSWSNLPEEDWCLQDDKPWVIGEFVWTGFDYLGEPTPYDEYWPSRSSYFGIFDLAGLPKDRYWLYRSHWNKNEKTIHLLPHWTWPGREGENIPVYCYTNYPTAELFVNGKSQGRITKQPTKQTDISTEHQELLDRYRLRWNDVRYEAGELRVVVYDENGVPHGDCTIRTAGSPHHILLSANKPSLRPDGEDMVFVTASVVDKDGNLCPEADNLLHVSVDGCADFKGICNGDATSLEVFTQPQMHVFKGQLMIGLISNGKTGVTTLHVTGKGLKSGELKIF